MGLFKQNTSQENKSVGEMKRSEREQAIISLERKRNDVIRDIEELMRLIAKQTRNKKYKKRRYKLGTSPNDFLE